MKTTITLFFIYAIIIIAVIVGEIKCIIKAVNCNWEPVGKAEVIYTIGVFTGAGAIIGYIDIKDN